MKVLRTTEYNNKIRCPSCNRKSNPETDYINEKNGKITKTCIKCRLSVKKSISKKPRISITQKKQIEGLKKIINLIDKDYLHCIINDDLKIFL